ncbi:MAG: L-glutamate gamma-semialdehyde dehydrogenase [Melioribacteraceae bacterium]|nr:L-glutamate gamma-semialdehyde dehydrogenase [Melioribacteraceae bacterium]MCF8354488.1 L-glutamate gamma-semialdehyde dehydrogenase [Melioribacteraceae bacterium]MCF8394098.1 L-glutamate gamma-semialdehyde dehydrogenase [Melioribacteraceae bacterium]MCF8419850.1 L-glutamate gamma-semialdehyde dehydrogenase [Melioribacteraceae bacterium]
MSNAYFKVPVPINEPVKTYEQGSSEKTELKKKLIELKSQQIEVPLIIGGEEVKTGNTQEMVIPHNKKHVLGIYHKAGKKEVDMAIEAALEAREEWAAMPWEHRAAIFLKMADLLAGPWRSTINGATMLGQSKVAHQAEIDSACELIDFWRFNTYYMAQIMSDQPYSPAGMWNRVEYRALEGFVFAVTPFNFTSIAGNLPTAPAMVGNVALWKPASSAVYSAYYLMKLFEEAGLPKGVINFVPGSGGQVGNPVMESPHLAGIHFTGSTAVFQNMWKTIGNNISKLKYYPRIVGETGGKDFIFAHNSADVDALVVAAIRGAFEYQGQKCSAASRMYIPLSRWDEFKEKYISAMSEVKMGDVEDFTNFMSAVIDEAAFKSITEYIDHAKEADDAEIITGGNYNDSEGYFIEPTTIITSNPKFKSMEEEIFGPVFTIYVYEDDKFDEALDLCDTTSPYALTGAIWAQDRAVLVKMSDKLQNAAGNFYINDKPTAAVVGQQPFGGGRASGTNDKAGSAMNLLRWMSVRTMKETFVPPKDWRYPFMSEK